MSTTLLLNLVLAAALAQPQKLVVDLDADHRPDTVALTHTSKQIEVTVTYGDRQWKPQSFRFAVDPNRHDAVCTLPVYLKREALDYDIAQAVGSPVEGFVRSPHLYGFVVMDNMCDSLHFYWNHATHRVEYWRA